MNNIVYVFLGGGIGSLARYGVAQVVRSNFKSTFPLATLCSNIISCFVLALMVGYFSSKMDAHPAIRTFIIVGICGGFSTFSGFSFETVELMRSGNMLFAIANILISVIVCFGLIYFLSKQPV